MNKRLMVIGLVCLMAFAARAQWWVGGSVSLRYNSTTLNSFTMDDRLVVRIAPEAGYNINAHWAVGMAVGYAYLQHANITVLNQTLPGSGNEVSFKPFARYIFKPLGRCRFYIDAGPAYTLLARISDSNLNAIGFRANIGIMVDISRRFALTGYLGDIGYQHSWVKVNRMTVRDNEFRFDVVNNFGLGVVIKMYNEKRRTKNDNP